VRRREVDHTLRRAADSVDVTRLVAIATVVALFVVQLVWFPLPLGLWIDGLARGVLGAM